MRVVLFIGVTKKRVSGFFIAVDSLKKGLKRLGHKVVFVSPSSLEERRDTSYSYESPLGVWVLPNIIDPTVFRKIDKFKPDIIHTHGVDIIGLVAIKYAFERNLPVVFTAHSEFRELLNLSFPWYLRFWFTPFLVFWIRSYINLCDSVIAPTKYIKKYLIEREKIMNPIIVQPSGIDLDRFRYKPRNLPHGKINILYVGSLTKRKNVEFLIKVMSFLDEDRYVLHIIGAGKERKKLERVVEKFELKNVKFYGQVKYSAIGKYYKSADLFAFSSLSESQGLVYIEAMAAGLPVVTIDNLGSREVIVNNETGVVLETANIKSFAQTIKRISSKKKLYEKLSRGAFEHAKKFDLENTVTATVDIYKDTIKNYHKAAAEPKKSFMERIFDKITGITGFKV